MDKNNSIEKFIIYLIDQKRSVESELKDFHVISENNNEFQKRHYKALLLKKYQINYFLDIAINGVNDDLFISFRSLSKMIYESSLSLDEKIEVLNYYILENSKLLDNSDELTVSSCVLYEDYNMFMNFPLNDIFILSNPNKLSLLINKSKKLKDRFNNMTDNIPYSFKSIIDFFNAYGNKTIDEIGYDRFMYILGSLGLIKVYKPFIDEIRKYGIRDLYNIRKCCNTLYVLDIYNDKLESIAEENNNITAYEIILILKEELLNASGVDAYEIIIKIDENLKELLNINEKALSLKPHI